MDNRKRMVSRGLTYEEKLMRRKMNNRISAQIARDRKKNFIKDLENKVLALENEKKSLAEENYKLYQILSTVKLQKRLSQLSHSCMDDNMSESDLLICSDMQPGLEIEVNSENTKISYNELIHRSLPSPPHSPIKIEYQMDNVISCENNVSQEEMAVDKYNSSTHLHQSFKNPAVISDNCPLPRENLMQRRKTKLHTYSKILRKNPFYFMTMLMIMMCLVSSGAHASKTLQTHQSLIPFISTEILVLKMKMIHQALMNIQTLPLILLIFLQIKGMSFYWPLRTTS